MAARLNLVLYVLCLVSALLPLRAGKSATVVGEPRTLLLMEFEGRMLEQLPLQADEVGFVANFPGQVSRYTDGSRELLVREVERATRKLHPSAHCLKAVGFSVTPAPHRVGPDDSLWGCVIAVRGRERMRVCEQISDSEGRTWSDVSSWFWATVLGSTEGPWLAVTLAERG